MEEDRYIQLLYKQLAGEIPSAEAEELAAWRASSADHEREARSVELAWELTAPAAEPAQVDLDEEFALLQDKMKPEAKVVSLRKRQGRTWWQVAAAILLLLAGGAWWLSSGPTDEVEWITVTTTSSARTVLLADQSKVVLNENSELMYPTTFVADQRTVQLKGEAFFEVTENPQQAFVIESPHAQTTVLGTAFNLKDEAAGTTAALQVESGRVRFASSNEEQAVIVTAGQGALWSDDSQQVILDEHASANVLAWRTGVLQFVGKPLSQVLQTVEEQFGLTFTIEATGLGNCLLDSRVDREDIPLFLEELETIFKVEVVELNPATYRLKGGNCP